MLQRFQHLARARQQNLFIFPVEIRKYLRIAFVCAVPWFHCAHFYRQIKMPGAHHSLQKLAQSLRHGRAVKFSIAN